MSDSRISILAFGAHPDDVEIGAGGAIAAATARGEAVVIVDLTRGERASTGDVDTRRQEASRGAQILGVSERACLGLRDAELHNDLPSRLRLVEAIRRYRPRIVLAPAWHDRHPDHHAAAGLVRDACHLAGIARVAAGDPFRPGKIYHYPIHEPAVPDLVLDISQTWPKKRAAIMAHASQFQGDLGGDTQTSLNGGGFARALEARAVAWGALIGARYGEAFLCRGPVPLTTLPSPAGDAWTRYGVP